MNQFEIRVLDLVLEEITSKKEIEISKNLDGEKSFYYSYNDKIESFSLEINKTKDMFCFNYSIRNNKNKVMRIEYHKNLSECEPEIIELIQKYIGWF